MSSIAPAVLLHTLPIHLWRNCNANFQEWQRLKDCQQTTIRPPIIMTKDLAISLLTTGKNGNQILQILDSIVLGDSVDECDELGAEPTLDPIAF